MWKKGEANEPDPQASVPVQPAPRARVEPAPAPAPAPAPRAGLCATIGPSIVVAGDVSGDEDLLVQGRVEGSIDLKEHTIVVGAEGKVKADVHGRTVTVEGELEGDVHGEEQIVLRASARVRGNLFAPRVILEDGANFRGGIDMETPATRERKAATLPGRSEPSPQRLSPAPPRSDPEVKAGEPKPAAAAERSTGS